MELSTLRVIFKTLSKGLLPEGTDLTVEQSAYNDCYDLRLGDSYLLPSDSYLLVFGALDGKALRQAELRGAAHVVTLCDHTLHELVARYREKVAAKSSPSKSKECPCGIHRADCDYHR